MCSPRKATIIFVAILLLFLLSIVSAELNKRDPQGQPAGGGGGGGGQPPAGGNPPAGGGGGGGGGQPPAGGNPPAGGGNPPGGGGNQPGGGNPPTGGGGGNKSPAGNPPGPVGGGGGNKSPAGNPPGGNPNPNNGTAPPKYVDPRTPQVQVQMIEPKSAKNILYKIGANITFRWTYSTNFSDPPTTIIVQAQPKIDLKTYFFIRNVTLNTTQEVSWNTAGEPSLPMSEYKLWISDQDGINGKPKPGGLLVYSGLTFGLYTPQDTGTFCERCNNAISVPTIALSSIIGLALITIASFNIISI